MDSEEVYHVVRLNEPSQAPPIMANYVVLGIY